MDELLRQYRLNKELYPSYMYATEEIRRAYKMYARLTRACGLSRETHLPMFGDVLVNILESLLEADELSPICMPDVSKFEIMTHEQAKKQFVNPSEKENLPTIYVTKYTKQIIPTEYFGNMIVYITGDEIPKPKWTRFEDTYICVSNRKLCTTDISEMLERYVFSYMRNRTELLYCMAQFAESNDYTEKLGRCLENRNKFTPSTPVKVLKHTFRQSKTPRAHQIVLELESLDDDVDLKEHLKRAKRSKITVIECPQVQELEKNVTEDVVHELTRKIPQILGVEYRLDTLVFTLDSSIMEDELAIDKIKSETNKVLYSRNIKENNIHFIFSKPEMNTKPKTSYLTAHQLVLESLDDDVDLKEHLKRAKTAEPRLLDAISEICTMYKRSEIPDIECPQVHELEKNVTEEVVHELTRKIPQILGVGYRLDTLVFTLDSSIMEDELAINKIKSETNKVFDSRNIKENNIHFIFSKPEMNTCASAVVGTGSFISAAGDGTLGGFVWKGNPPDKICCLISANHVLHDELDNRNVYLKSPNTAIKSMIAETLQPIPNVDFRMPVDIAAAKLKPQPKDEPSLLDLACKPVDSRVYDYQNHDQVNLLKGRKVYLWGANITLRKGKITTPEYYRKGKTNLQKYVGLENLDSDEESGDETTAGAEGNRRVLATKGDSGSLVCAGTRHRRYVDAIGMLMGEEYISDDSIKLGKTSGNVTKSAGEQEVKGEREETIYERTASDDNRSGTVDSSTKSESEAPDSSCVTRRSRPLYLAFDLQAGLRHMSEKYKDDFRLCKSVNNP